MKQSILKLALKEFDKNTWLLMGLMFFSKAGFFMTIPYFSFYLYYRGYTPMEIGLVIAMGPLVSALLNVWSGFLTDKFGKKASMVVAFIVFATASMGIARFDGFWLYMSLNAVLRLSDATFSNAMQAYFADNFSKEVSHIVFHIRFMTVNAAAAIGPIAGALFAHSHTKMLFDLSAGIAVIAAILLVIYLDNDKKKRSKNIPQEETPITLKVAFATLLRAPALLWMTLAYFLFWITYIQLDSTFAQVLSRIYPEDAVYLFALTWVINTVMIVVGQLPIAHLTQKWSYQRLSCTSALSMAAGFLVLACFFSTAGIVICIVLVTFGEILMSPMGSVLIARIAPPKLRATYFGALNLGFLGAGLAPILGSACLTFMSPAGLFLSMTGLLLCMLVAMLKSVRNA